jgi:hypothetical protein
VACCDYSGRLSITSTKTGSPAQAGGMPLKPRPVLPWPPDMAKSAPIRRRHRGYDNSYEELKALRATSKARKEKKAIRAAAAARPFDSP